MQDENAKSITYYCQRLELAGIRDPYEEIKKIIELISGKEISNLNSVDDLDMEESQFKQLEDVVLKRIKHIPLERIFGRTKFSGVDIETSPSIFKPYVETEDIVKHALKLFPDVNQNIRILDLGTGTGCLLLALVKSLPNASGVGIDLDNNILELANKNAVNNKLNGCVEFRKGDWDEGITEKFDLVISNPPRTSTLDIKYLVPEMRDHDPVVSLDGGIDGLAFFKRMSEKLNTYTKNNGFAVIQTGPKQISQVIRIFREKGFKNIKINNNDKGFPSSITVQPSKMHLFSKLLVSVTNNVQQNSLFSKMNKYKNFVFPNKVTPLSTIIKKIISLEGPITIERYMELVLHHPQYGYYQSGDPLGIKGDFGTAPEISQLFGEMVGIWCVESWQRLGKPSNFVLLELGPGRGTLMKDLLAFTSEYKEFQKSLKVFLIESNRTLRAMQQAKLESFSPTFINDIDQLPKLPIITIANEFFDTFPVRQFVYQENRWNENMVNNEGGKFKLIMRPTPTECDVRFPSQEGLTDGWIYEVSSQSEKYLRKLFSKIEKIGGVVLVCDYGYFELSGESTLDAWSKQTFTYLFDSPGRVDVTCGVNYSSIRDLAHNNNLEIRNLENQSQFLNRQGIMSRAEKLVKVLSEEKIARLYEDLNRLLDPKHMGNAFKVIDISSKN